MRAVVFTLLAFSFAVAAPVPRAKKRPDAEVFVGSWDLVVTEYEGRPIDKGTWIFDEKLELKSVSPNEGGRFTTWDIKLDPEKSPKEIDVGGFKGIYEFDGEDIRVAFASGDRPTTFAAKEGVYYYLLRRVESKKGK